MEKLLKNWTDFKSLIDQDMIFVEHKKGDDYMLYAQDGNIFYKCQLDEDTSTDRTDYETSYQSKKSIFLHPTTVDGKEIICSASRPLGTNTNFAISGDFKATQSGEVDKINGSEKWLFDFTNNVNDVDNPPEGYKRKQIQFTFLDDVWLKEGTVYWEGMPFGSYARLGFMVPPYAPYYANSGIDAGKQKQNLTGAPLLVHRFSASPMMGSCPMGDELNTEASSDRPIPAGAIGLITITVPDISGLEAHCAVQVELYRTRSVILE